VESTSEAIEVVNADSNLRDHPKYEDRLLATFGILGKKIQDSVRITATSANLHPVEAVAEVVETKVEDHDFTREFEFEHATYRLREGSKKTLQCT
jgi:hypothetical protein